MKEIPKIEKYMTAMPHTVNAGIPLKSAAELMRKHGIRHLPVLSAGKLVGVITDRDVKLATSFDGADKILVEDAMAPDTFSTNYGTPLNEVLVEMVEHKYGCAVVTQDNGKVIGIFTAIDGMRAFCEVLNSRFKPGAR